jgi:hypothetical protein
MLNTIYGETSILSKAPRTTQRFLPLLVFELGTAVAQWLRCFATNRKVAGSIPDGVIAIFH